MRLFGRRESILEAEQKLERTEALLAQTRQTIVGLEQVIGDVQKYMDELEAELQTRTEEV